jgi:hypothetical protein
MHCCKRVSREHIREKNGARCTKPFKVSDKHEIARELALLKQHGMLHSLHSGIGSPQPEHILIAVRT